MKSYDELKKDGDAFLEHYGVKGMKWRKRKRNKAGVDTLGKDKSDIEGHFNRILSTLNVPREDRKAMEERLKEYKNSPSEIFRKKKKFAKEDGLKPKNFERFRTITTDVANEEYDIMKKHWGLKKDVETSKRKRRKK